MSQSVQVAVASVIGAVLAGLAVFGLVASQSSTPEPKSQLVTYDG